MVLRFRVECELNWRREDFWRVMSHPAFLQFLVEDGCLKRITATEAEYHAPDDVFRRVRTYVPKTVEASEMLLRVVGDSLLEVHDHQAWNHAREPFVVAYDIRPTFLREFIETKGLLMLFASPDEAAEQLDASELDLAQAAASTAATAAKPVQVEAKQASKANGSTKGNPNGAVGAADIGETGGDGSEGLKAAAEECAGGGDGMVHVVTGACSVKMFYVGQFLEQAVRNNMLTFYRHYPRHCAAFKRYVVQEVLRARGEKKTNEKFKSERVAAAAADGDKARAEVIEGEKEVGEAEEEEGSGALHQRLSAAASLAEEEGIARKQSSRDDAARRAASVRAEFAREASAPPPPARTARCTSGVELIAVPREAHLEPDCPVGESFPALLDEFLHMIDAHHVSAATQTGGEDDSGAVATADAAAAADADAAENIDVSTDTSLKAPVAESSGTQHAE